MGAYTDHAYDRAVERFGLAPAKEAWDKAVLDIIGAVAGEARKALLLRRDPRGTEIWAVLLDGVAVRVAYDPATACIVTVLGKSWN